MKVNSKKTNFAVIDSDITPMDITDTDLLSEYSAEVIEFAKKLKGQHEKNNETGSQYFTDKYYLDYAQKYLTNLQTARNNSHLALVLYDMNNSVPDPEWSEFSYEEIIAMADNGVNVPKNVLGWAKAQQESDVTAYVIVSDNAENDDNSSTSEVAGESDINKLRAQAQSYITRANKEQKKAVEEAEKIENSVEEAKTQKSKFESKAKDTTQNTKNISAEYMELAAKKASGQITPTEIARLNQLKGQIGVQETEGARLKQEGAILDDFLNSIDTFNETQENAMKLSKEAKDAGINFGQLDKTYSDRQISHAVNNFQTSSIGTLDDLMAGISDGTISETTIIKAKDFEQIGEDVNKIVQESKSSDIVKFAQTQENSQNTEENTTTSNPNQTAGTLIKSTPTDEYSATKANDAYADYNKSNKSKAADKMAEKESSDLDNVKTQAGYGPDVAGEIKTAGMVNTGVGAVGAVAAGAFMGFNAMATVLIPTNITNTALTLTSMGTLAINNSNVKKTKEILKKNQKTLTTEMKNLQKAATDLEKAHEANVALGEILYSQAKELEEKTQDYIIQFMTKAEEKSQKAETNENNTQGTQQGQAQEELQDPFAGERTALAGQMDNLAQKDAMIFDKSKTPLKRTNKAEINAAKSVTSLGNQNKKLEEANKVNKTQSILSVATGGISLVIGAMGLIKGFKQIATGKGEILSGTPMLASPDPVTKAAGTALIVKGVADVAKGTYGVAVSTAALITGGAAGIAGAGGLILSNQIKGNIKDNKNTVKTEGKEISQQRKLYLRIKKAMAKSKQAKVPQIAAQSQAIAQAQGMLSSSDENSAVTNNNTQPLNQKTNNTQTKTSNTPQTQSSNTADVLTSPAAKQTSKEISNTQPNNNFQINVTNPVINSVNVEIQNNKTGSKKENKTKLQTNIAPTETGENKDNKNIQEKDNKIREQKNIENKQDLKKTNPNITQKTKEEKTQQTEKDKKDNIADKKEQNGLEKTEPNDAKKLEDEKTPKTEKNKKDNIADKKEQNGLVKTEPNDAKKLEDEKNQQTEKDKEDNIADKKEQNGLVKTEPNDAKKLEDEKTPKTEKDKEDNITDKKEQNGLVKTEPNDAEKLEDEKTPKTEKDKEDNITDKKEKNGLVKTEPNDAKKLEDEKNQQTEKDKKDNIADKKEQNGLVKTEPNDAKKLEDEKTQQTEKDKKDNITDKKEQNGLVKTEPNNAPEDENNLIKPENKDKNIDNNEPLTDIAEPTTNTQENTETGSKIENTSAGLNVLPQQIAPNNNKQVLAKPELDTNTTEDKTKEKLPSDKRLEKTENKSDEEKVLLKDKNIKAANNLNQPENKDEDKNSVNPSKVKNVEVKSKVEPKKPEFNQAPQKASETEVIPIKDNDGRTVNLTNDRIQPHTNKKFEETKLKDEENLRKTKEDQNKKELAKNINDTNTEILKEAIIAQIEGVVNKNDDFEGKNPTETNTIISNQIDAINSLKQRFASIDDRSENISASATVNANPKDRVHTDDKADKKLARFNNDSIIESKKKRKKVVAVSEAFGGSTKR